MKEKAPPARKGQLGSALMGGTQKASKPASKTRGVCAWLLSTFLQPPSTSSLSFVLCFFFHSLSHVQTISIGGLFFSARLLTRAIHRKGTMIENSYYTGCGSAPQSTTMIQVFCEQVWAYEALDGCSRWLIE